jgi:TolA-binding protein
MPKLKARACSARLVAEGLVMSVFVLSVVVGSLFAAVEPIPQNVRDLMQDRNYKAAEAAIDEALKAPNADKAQLRYLQARTVLLQGRFDAAAKAFAEIASEYKDVPLGRQAKFAEALARARLGDFRAAEEIYRDLASKLLSEERQNEIASLYLEFADVYFKPPKENQAPDYAKALAFYQKALEAGPKPERKSEIELQIARCHRALNQWAESAAILAKFVKDYAKSPLIVEAMFLLGDSRLKLGDPLEARRVWQDLLAEHPKADSSRIPEAAYSIGKTWGMPQPGTDEQLEQGVAALENFLKANPGDVLAGKAALEIAQGYLHRNRTEQGIAALKRFLGEEKWATLKEVADARVLLGRSYAGQKKFDDALAAFNDYLSKHPAHGLWSQVQAEIIQTENAKANELRVEKKYAEARTLWEVFLAKYPLYGNAPNVMFEFGQMNFEQKKYADAVADWRRVVSKYPGHDVSSQAQYRVAETLEKELKQPEEALKEYKAVTWGSAQGQAQARISWLTSKGMTIATERVFRTNETPAVDLVSRNIDAFNVRAWTVDLETYFRKMHLAAGLESLDISLIDPDKAFEFRPKNYAEYREQKSDVSLDGGKVDDKAAGKPQVMVVTVSGKTLEATTLVIRSDLEILVKSGRDEVFVFAQNLRTGKPWPKAKLLLSNGKKVFAEAETGPDGVFKGSYEELKQAADIRVFAVADGHTASNVVSLAGLGVATGVTPRGYLYTDRPGYRAGQLVHVKGVVRDVTADKYTVPKGRKLKVEVFDPRNRTLESRDVDLSGFGSFHAAFPLPPSSPPGAYRVVARDLDNRTYEQTFQVSEYRLESLKIAIDTERSVYYRGEKIEGSITVAYYYGVPAADKEVRYQLQGEDQPTIVGRTDAQGKIKFSFPTRAYRETQTIALSATLPEFNLSTAKNFVLSTKGFNVAVTTPRSVYVQGESFESQIVVKDAEGKPLGRKIKLNVFERTAVDNRVAERLLETFELDTDAKTGIARKALTLPKGGRYILRAEAVDRFQNVVSGEKLIAMSDDKDTVRLRILAEMLSYRVGDDAEVVVHWREEPAVALVTHQGAKVLGYQLVELVKGANKLKIPMTSELAPNFELSIDVMTDARPDADRKAVLRYHHAAAPVTVERDLKLKLSIARKDGKEGPPTPGDEVVAKIEATDSRGNPVSAEVSIAAVEQALLDQFGASVGDNAIGAYFLGGRRQTALRTGSSVTFTYRPRTTAIAAALLAEREREEIDAIEAETRGELADAPRDAGALAANRADPGEPKSKSALRRGGVRAPGGTTGGFGGGGGLGGGMAGAPGGPPRPQSAAAPMMAAREGQLEEKLMAKKDGDVKLRARLGRVALGEEAKAGENAPDVAYMDSDWAEGKPGAHFRFGVIAPSKDNFTVLADRGVNEFNMWYAQNGAYKNYNFAKNPNAQGSRADREKFFQDFSDAAIAAGGVVVQSRGPVETAFWTPAVVTDAAGKAETTFTLPERSTAWRVIAKGVTMETLAGEADTSIVAKKDLFGELKAPLAFTDGDATEIEAVVSNDAAESDVVMTLTTTVGDKTTTDKKTLKAVKGRQTVRFPVKISRPEAQSSGPEVDVAFTLKVEAGQASDVVRKISTIQPYGVAVYSAASGAADADTTAFIDAPSNMEVASPSLQIMIGSSIERSLLDVLFGPPNWIQVESVRRGAGVESTASDLQAALALQQLIGATRDAGSPQAQSLDSRVRSAVSSLVSAQMDDGGWTWANPKAGSNHYTTSRVAWTLAMARKAGYPVPQDCVDKSTALLQSRLAQIPQTDLESTATVLHGLAALGRADFGVANRLHRDRPRLSNAALAYLALIHLEMDRKQMAAELLDLLSQKGFNTAPTARCLPWNSGEAELRALVALAEQGVNPASPRIKQQIDWLESHRTGHRWSPDKATGPATAALSKWYSRSRVGGDKYTLAVFVNDALFKTLELSGDSGSQTLDVPTERLVKGGKQRVQFGLTGRGRYTYQCTYGGFVAADKLKSTDDHVEIRRYYEPAPLDFDGKPVPRGFDVVSGSYTHFRNPLTQFPVGGRAEVTIDFNRRRYVSAEGPESYPYLVVTEPLPSGATVDEKSISGSFERYELTPGAITFYLGAQYAASGRYYLPQLKYTLVGYIPGTSRIAPTMLRDAYKPEKLYVSGPTQLAVLPYGEKSKDPYRLTPRELFELGKREFDKKMLKEAAEHLTELFTKWAINPDVYKETARLLLETHLETGPSAGVVKYFEIIKEKHPDLEIPFAKILKVGAAYHDMGEYERSYLIFRATTEAAFQKDAQAAGFLESQGEFLRSVAFMQRLCAEFPPEQYNAGAFYALAQRVYAKAPEAARDARLREKRVGKTDLLRRAEDMLDSFLTTYPDDPAADQAAFALANTLLDMKSYKDCIAQCEKYAKRYAGGDYLDSYWFATAYSYFALGNAEKALEMCRKVVEAKRKDKATGRPIDAANKWEAIYILGQVYHSLGKAAEAVAEYKKVAERFLDAKQAIDFFLRKAVSAPEVVAVKPGEPAKFPLKFRNVPTVDVKAYRIDLLKFGLLRRDLGNITSVNLSGVKPYHEAVVNLGDGKDYRDRTHDLMLPLKEAGAYLVVCRAEDLYTSGLVLVTPLALEIQEEVESGRVRATVKNTVDERYVPNVQVRVIGSANPDFVAGPTDLRGVFVADGILGNSTVIAKADAGYAFHRGKSWLGNAPQPVVPNAPAQAAGQQQRAMPAQTMQQELLLDNLRGLNRGNQEWNNQQLKQNFYDKNTQGVPAKSAY